MTIHFEVTPYWVEFWCHFLAAFFYIVSGGVIASTHIASDGEVTIAGVCLAIAITLSIIGAHQ